MKMIFFIVITFISVLIISCSEINSPPTNENTQNPFFGCQIMGIELDFVDTCSYDFINQFISQFDSVTVAGSFLGSTFYLYADSGNYENWLHYFENDTTIDRIDAYYPAQDSLILVVKLTGQKSVDEETLRFSQIPHITIQSIEVHRKTLFLEVAENSEERWKLIFEQYPFISFVNIIAICTCF